MVIRMMYLALRNVSLANFILVSVMASVHVHARVQGQPLDARHVCQSFKCSNWVTFIKWTKCTCYLFKMKRAFSEFAGPRRRNARPLMLDNSNSCLILDLLPGSRDIAMVSSAPSSPAPASPSWCEAATSCSQAAAASCPPVSVAQPSPAPCPWRAGWCWSRGSPSAGFRGPSAPRGRGGPGAWTCSAPWTPERAGPWSGWGPARRRDEMRWMHFSNNWPKNWI